jgi:hypothetical protein
MNVTVAIKVIESNLNCLNIRLCEQINLCKPFLFMFKLFSEMARFKSFMITRFIKEKNNNIIL